MAYRRGCAAQRVAFLSSCARRSDDADARSGVASGRLAVGSALMLPHLFAAERMSPSARERVPPMPRPSDERYVERARRRPLSRHGDNAIIPRPPVGIFSPDTLDFACTAGL